jgi:hypothetical protein
MEAVGVSDPLRILWDALEAHGCRPKGKPHDFRACCSAHDGENRDALHVAIGADGRAVVFCHAHQCEAEAIVAALGLGVADLFPNGHHRARRRASKPVRRSDFSGPAHIAANVLYALEQLEEPWRLMLAADCPYCGSPGAWLYVRSRRTVLANGLIAPDGRTELDCPNGCSTDNYVQALLGRLEETKS